MLRVVTGLFVFGATAIAAIAGQDAVTIKVAKPKAGDTIKVVRTEKTNSSVNIAAQGKSQAKDDVVTRNIAYTDELITVTDGKPTKLKRTYDRYDVSKGGKDDIAPPLKTAILVEKKDGKFQFTVDDKPLDAPIAVKLAPEFEKASGGKVEDLLPAKAVKAGDTWKVDGAKMAAAVGGAGANLLLDADKSEVNGKLVKTYQKDGKQYGVLEFTGEIVIKSLGEKVPVKIKPGSKLGFKMTADTCIDGTDPALKLTGALSVKLEAEGMGLTLTIAANGTMAETHELTKK